MLHLITLLCLLVLTLTLMIGLTAKNIALSPSILLIISTSIIFFIIMLRVLFGPLSCGKSKPTVEASPSSPSPSDVIAMESNTLEPKDLMPNEVTKKVTIDTGKNKEIEIETGRLEIDYNHPSNQELQEISQADYPMHGLNQRNQKDCTVDLSCVVQGNHKSSPEDSSSIQGYLPKNDNLNYRPNQDDKGYTDKGYMNTEELEGYIPSSLGYCQDFSEGFESSLFESAPPKGNTQLCRHCKVGYCLGGVCGANIYKKPSELEDYLIR